MAALFLIMLKIISISLSNRALLELLEHLSAPQNGDLLFIKTIDSIISVYSTYAIPSS